MSQYFVYKIGQGPTDLVKSLNKIDQFDSYKDAKQRVKGLRQEQGADEAALYKIIFAESELQAEELLHEKREAPIVQEWEK